MLTLHTILIQKMLSRKARDRLGVNDMSQIKRHRFFEGLDWDALQKRQFSPPILRTQSSIQKEDELENLFLD